jgi:uncharacterized repeat protein (TIGR03803 family)
MTKERQYRNSSTSIWWKLVRSAITGPTVGILLLSTGTAARSQDAKAQIPPTYSVLYTFTGGADGANPLGGNLLLDPAGTLYGTAGSAGDLSCSGLQPPGCGVVFKLDRTGKETALHSFTGGADGSFPVAGVVRDDAGNLYGSTYAGGSKGSGVVYKLDSTGKESVLYSFTGGADGNGPFAGLIRDDVGNLYGTTYAGGSDGLGVVFKLDSTGKESVLYSFTGEQTEHILART